MQWRLKNDIPQVDGYYFIKEGDSGGGRYYFETIGGGQWRWHEYAGAVGKNHSFEWLDESLPASAEQEAARLYPNVDETTIYSRGEYHYGDVVKFQRSAHITCAGMYTGEIEKGAARIKEQDKRIARLEKLVDRLDGENSLNRPLI